MTLVTRTSRPGGGPGRSRPEPVARSASPAHRRAAAARAPAHPAPGISSARLRQAFDHARIPCAVIGADGRLVAVNAALCRLLDRPSADLLGSAAPALVHPLDRRRSAERLADALRRGASRFRAVERRVAGGGGRAIPAILWSTRLDDGTGPAQLLVQVEEVTDRRQAEADARRRLMQEALLAGLGSHALRDRDLDALLKRTALLISEGLGAPIVTVLECDRGCRALRLRAGLGVRPSELGMLWSTTAEGLDGPRRRRVPRPGGGPAAAPGDQVLQRLGMRVELRSPIDTRTERYGVLAAASSDPGTFSDDDEHFLHGVASIVGAAVDRLWVEDQAHHQALHDPITGLPNRTLLLDRLTVGLAAIAIHPGVLAVCLVDLDRFRVVNESLGRSCGDDCLRQVALRLAATLRPGDTLARLDGDEYVIVAQGIDGPAAAAAIAAGVQLALRAPFAVADEEVVVGASSGLVTTDDPASLAADLLRDADLAMMEAKQQGGGATVIVDPRVRRPRTDRLQADTDLRRALEREELVVHYQPIIDLDSGQVVAAEALVRWRHPTRGVLAPGGFIPLAEETGLIVPLGDFVLRRACRDLVRWRRLGGRRPLRVGVNVAVRQLRTPGFADTVGAILAAESVDPTRISLEITESSLLGDGDQAVAVLRALRRLGVHLVLDDFGTGFSSLRYLQRFPIEVIKVDRSFVTGLGSDPQDTALVTAIVNLARALGLRVVAEGVETRAQLDQLRDIGCGMAQGFLISPAVPAAALAALWVSGRRW